MTCQYCLKQAPWALFENGTTRRACNRHLRRACADVMTETGGFFVTIEEVGHDTR